MYKYRIDRLDFLISKWTGLDWTPVGLHWTPFAFLAEVHWSPLESEWKGWGREKYWLDWSLPGLHGGHQRGRWDQTDAQTVSWHRSWLSRCTAWRGQPDLGNWIPILPSGVHLNDCYSFPAACGGLPTKLPKSADHEKHILAHLYDFHSVFSKDSFGELPGTKPWDHMVELLPDATLKSCKVYPLATLEQKELDAVMYVPRYRGNRYQSTGKRAKGIPWSILESSDESLNKLAMYFHNWHMFCKCINNIAC